MTVAGGGSIRLSRSETTRHRNFCLVVMAIARKRDPIYGALSRAAAVLRWIAVMACGLAARWPGGASCLIVAAVRLENRAMR